MTPWTFGETQLLCVGVDSYVVILFKVGLQVRIIRRETDLSLMRTSI